MRIAILAILALPASCAARPRADYDKQYADAYRSVVRVQVSIRGDELDRPEEIAIREIYQLMAPDASAERTHMLEQILTVTGKPVGSVYCTLAVGFACPRNHQIQVDAGYELTVVFERHLGGKMTTFQHPFNHLPKAVRVEGRFAHDPSPSDLSRARRNARSTALERMLGNFCVDAMRMFAVGFLYKTLTSANPRTSKACLEWNQSTMRQERIARSIMSRPELPSDLRRRAAAVLSL